MTTQSGYLARDGGRIPSGSPMRELKRSPYRAALTSVVLGVVLTTGAVLGPAGPARAASAVGQIAPHGYQGGGVGGFGGAQSINAPLGSSLSSLMVAMAPDQVASAGRQGYWLAAADGGVFAQGTSDFYGSLGALHLNGPVVGMAATPDGKG